MKLSEIGRTVRVDSVPELGKKQSLGSCRLRTGIRSPPSSNFKPKWRNWQTRMVQVHVPARVWGFESLLRHQITELDNIQREWAWEGKVNFSPVCGKSDLALSSKTPILPEKTESLLTRSFCISRTPSRECLNLMFQPYYHSQQS